MAAAGLAAWPTAAEVRVRAAAWLRDWRDAAGGAAAGGAAPPLQLSAARSSSGGGRRLEDARQRAGYVRVFVILELVERLLATGKKATLRELYYAAASHPQFAGKSQNVVNASVNDVATLLRCPRHCLNVVAASRGQVAGNLLLREGGRTAAVDCSDMGAGGHAITGDIDALCRAQVVACDAAAILVIEKDATFQHLAERRLWDSFPSILITARGFPDVATRMLLRVLHEAMPRIPVLGVVDFNPAGCGILLTYRNGGFKDGIGGGEGGGEGGASASTAANESEELMRRALGVPVHWFGPLAADLADLPTSAFQVLGVRRRGMLDRLIASSALAGTQGARERAQLMAMSKSGRIAEIQAIDAALGEGALVRMLLRKLARWPHD